MSNVCVLWKLSFISCPLYTLYIPIQLTFFIIHYNLIKILYQLYIYVVGVKFAQMVCCVWRTEDVLICGVNKPVGWYPSYIWFSFKFACWCFIRNSIWEINFFDELPEFVVLITCMARWDLFDVVNSVVLKFPVADL